MVQFLEFNNLSFLEEYLSQEIGFDLLEYYTAKDKDLFTRVKLSNWQELSNYSTGVDSLFSTEIDESENYLVNIQDLKIDQYSSQLLNQIQSNSENKFYLYSYDKEKLLADEKKYLKKEKIEVVKVPKSSEELRLKVVADYSQKIGLDSDSSFLKSLSKSTISVQEAIDKIDFLDLAEISKESLKDCIDVPGLPIFMYSFSTNNLNRDAVKWIKAIGEDEIQLGLSLIFTKLSKQETKASVELKKELLRTDYLMKNISKVKALTWWKLFLYKAKVGY
jgi:hypothetical protein